MEAQKSKTQKCINSMQPPPAYIILNVWTGGVNFLSVDLSTTVDLTNKALEMRLLKQLTFFLSLWFMFFINFLI